MDKYYITHSAISVRVNPNAESKIVNILKPNSIVQTVSEVNGWLKTISGQYILKSEHIELVDSYNKRMIRNGASNKVIKIMRPKITVNNIGVARTTSTSNTRSGISPRIETDEVKPGDTVRINAGMKDINGTFIPSDAYTVVNDGVNSEQGTIKITDGKGTTYTLNAENVEIWDTVNNDWQDVTVSEEQQQERQVQGIIDYIMNGAISKETSPINIDRLNVSHTRSIYGMPYQFTPIVDNRLDGSFNAIAFGRKYAEKIVGRMPMMVMQAGVPEFMQGFSDDDVSRISTAIMQQFNLKEDNSDLNNLVNQSGKYYSLKITSEEYYDCVNPMCWAIAMFLGIDGVEVTINGHKDKLGTFRWQEVSQNPAWGYYQGSVAFYINSDAQIQETFANSTTQSQLANRLNQLGALGQEMQFLLGGVTNASGFNMTSFGKETLDSDGKYNFTSNRGALGVVDNLIANVKTLIAGGKMIFPEIWSDSQFMRSYNVTIKLDSPDCDNLSIYLNILVPLCHILGFVQPRRVGTNVYISPFLVRAFYKSMFHVDMGIITECSITKGDVGAWNQNGLPTQMTISLTIKDLYNVLSMSTNVGTNDLIGNPFQLDYLANMCGVNIGEPSMIRTLRLWYLIRGINRVNNNLHSAWLDAMNQIYRRINNLWESNFTM